VNEDTLRLGQTGELEWTVEDRHCIHRGEHEVFSTPNLVELIEYAAMEALSPALGEGQESVGSGVTVSHLQPTRKGERVTGKARIVAVDRRRVSFEVEAFDPAGKIAEGTHQRFIVDLDRFGRHLAERGGSAEVN